MTLMSRAQSVSSEPWLAGRCNESMRRREIPRESAWWDNAAASVPLRHDPPTELEPSSPPLPSFPGVGGALSYRLLCGELP
jgi:hypothetical protein